MSTYSFVGYRIGIETGRVACEWIDKRFDDEESGDLIFNKLITIQLLFPWIVIGLKKFNVSNVLSIWHKKLQKINLQIFSFAKNSGYRPQASDFSPPRQLLYLLSWYSLSNWILPSIG